MAELPLLENVFLDRDGTIIHDRNYLSDPAGVELLPGAGAALSRLSAWGLRLFVVTNQSGIGRGYFSVREYEACKERLDEILAAEGVVLADSAFCPHAPSGAGGQGCRCRKPDSGMWEELRERRFLSAFRSVMIGDKPEDILFGKNSGFAATILALTGKGAQSAVRLGLPALPPESSFYETGIANGGWPEAVARDLEGAADFIRAKFAIRG